MIENYKSKEEFFAQEHIAPHPKFGDCAPNKAYKLAETGHHIYEVEINSGLNLETPVEIAQLTDLHFHFVSEEDWNDDEIMYTAICRQFMANGWSIRHGIKSLAAADYSDQIIITGDILDYLSKGAVYMVKRHILNKYPNVLCNLGGHDITKQMQTNLPDRLPLEERHKILGEFWPHDLFYTSKTVKNKVMCILLDNSQGHYPTVIAEKLEKDINSARKNGYVILLFQHEPISTGNPNDTNVIAQFNGDQPSYNFYNAPHLCCAPENLNENDRKVYNLITTSADVIKGVFNGHLHSGYYTEVKASYTDKNGMCQKAVIPQITSTTNIYFQPLGGFTRIIVK